jgi:hypothetical protein
MNEQVRDLQGRFAELEQAAREAEAHISQERLRMVQERQELDRLRGGLWPAAGPAPGAETLVDEPSPLRHLPEMAAALKRGEAPRAPSQTAAVSG